MPVRSFRCLAGHLPFRSDRSGASLPEYAMIVGLISLVAVAAVGLLGTKVDAMFDRTTEELAMDGTGAGSGSGGSGGGSEDPGDGNEDPDDGEDTPSSVSARFALRQFGADEIDEVLVAVSGATAGDLYSLAITSSGGGSPFATTGTFAGASTQLGPLDLSGLALGDLTLTLTAFDGDTSNEIGSATDQASYSGGDAYPNFFENTTVTGIEPGGGVVVYIDTGATDVPLDASVDTPGAYFCVWDIDYENCDSVGTDTVFNPGDEAYVFIPGDDDFEVTDEIQVTVGSRTVTITAVTRGLISDAMFRDGGSVGEVYCASGSPISAAQLYDTCYFANYLDGWIDPGLHVDWDVVWFDQADWAPTIVVGTGSPHGRYCDDNGCTPWATSGQLTSAEGWMEFRIQTNGILSPSSNPNFISGSWSMFSPRIYDTDGDVASEMGPGVRNRH